MSVRDPQEEPSELYMSGAWVFLWLNALKPWGVTACDLLDGLGLDESSVEQPDTRLSPAQVIALVRRARQLTNEPGLGMWVGTATHANTFGYVSFASQCAATLGQAIDLTIRYSAIFCTMLGFRLNRADGIAGLVVDEHCDLGDARDALLLCTLIGVRTVGCMLTGREPWRPIDMAIPEPPYYRRLAHLVPELRFNQPISQIVLLESDLELPLLTPDRGALRQATEKCEDELRALGVYAAIEERTLNVLSRRDGFLSFDEVASALGLSSRTFKRRLAEANITFSEIVEKARRERALLLLRSPLLSLDEVADRLGYSTVSNLVRAFRRWTGMTPSAYRREVGGRLSIHLPLRR